MFSQNQRKKQNQREKIKDEWEDRQKKGKKNRMMKEEKEERKK